jgi:hypothetical protein
MIETVDDLQRILGGTGAEILELTAQVQSVHRDKFALWSAEDDAEYEVNEAYQAAIWDPAHPGYDSPTPYYGATPEVHVFESIQDIRTRLGGKKILFYAYGTMRANLDWPPGWGQVGVPKTDGKTRLRYALWEKQ